ncbi:MAG: ABC transporter ATP-binding protein [Chloroflexota bacterium]
MNILLRCIGYLRRYGVVVFWAILSLVGSSLLGLVMPWMIQRMIDTALEYGAMSVVGLYAVGSVAVALLNGACGFGQRFAMAIAVQGAVYDLGNQLYNYVMRLSFSYHDRARTGQLISRLTSDLDAISQFLSFGLSGIVGIVITLVGASYMLFRMSWQLGLMGILLLPPMSFIALKGSSTLGPRFLALRQQFGRITGQLQENFAGVRVVKAFAREDHEVERFRRELREYLKLRMGVIKVFSLFMPSMNLLSNAGALLILAYGGYAVMDGRLSIGELVASQGYLMMLTGPIQMIGMMVMNARRAMASGERVFDILDTRNEVVEKPGAIALPPTTGAVTFEDVSFGYDKASPVLKHINLDVRSGETIALLGATGSGKTSVINLIPRFYDVTAGRVLIDGYDVRDVTLPSLRSQIATIFQEAVLFTGTIAENIAFGRPDATMDEIVAAAKAAQAHDFVLSFPDGYQTKVGERGVTVSGGQRQRLTIARALLLNARILIMDDSTSSVDVETEYLIQQALTLAMRDRTAFVIAHRLSTVKTADRILVLAQGEIVEEGTHGELLALDGHYRRIYDTQFADQEERVVA